MPQDFPPPPPPNYPHASAGYGYAPPPHAERPRVWPWFVTYAVLMALMYFILGGVGITLLVLGPEQLASAQHDATEIMINGVVLSVCAVLGIPFALAPFLPRKPGVWVFDLVLICLGLTSPCCLPMTIPLLIFWLKPETKVWFGRGA